MPLPSQPASVSLSPMKKVFLLVVGLLSAAGAPGAAAAELEPLFDGRGLDNWIKRGGTATYEVIDGAIVGTTFAGSPNTFLCPPTEYGDFILEYESWVDSRLNAGVQIRSHQFAQDATVFTLRDGKLSRKRQKAGHIYGYQVEMDPSDRAWSAGIYDESRHGWIADLSRNEKARKAFKKDDWNEWHGIKGFTFRSRQKIGARMCRAWYPGECD